MRISARSSAAQTLNSIPSSGYKVGAGERFVFEETTFPPYLKRVRLLTCEIIHRKHWHSLCRSPLQASAVISIDLRAPTISVRGIENASHVVLWSGQANATTYRSSPMGARITWLTRHALSAAWGENSMESVADETWLCQPELDRLFAGLVMLLNVGCNMKSGLASSPRTPYWQLLLTQSLSVVSKKRPFRFAKGIRLQWKSHGLHLTTTFERTDSMPKLLSNHGLRVEAPSLTATLLPTASACSCRLSASKQQDTFFGIPRIQSGLCPISVPELTLYRNVRDRGYSRLSIPFIYTE